MSKPLFSANAWEDYLYWQSQDKKTLKRINALVKDIERNGNAGIGAGTFAGRPVRLLEQTHR
jgi:toxin YoeB